MLKKWYRISAFALAGALCVSAACLGACGGEENKIKITVGFWQDNATAREQALYDELKEGFEQLYPRYELVASGYAYSENTVTAKFVSGQLPTVFEMDVSQAESAFYNGYIRDVAPLLKRYGWYEKADGELLAEISSGGSVYGIPDSLYAVGMLLNLNMLAEAGVIARDGERYALYDGDVPLYPRTFSEIEEASKKIYMRYGKEAFGLFVPSEGEESGFLFANMIYNFGCDAIESVGADGTRAATFSQETVGGAMRWIKSMAQNGYVDNSEAYGVEDLLPVMERGGAAVAFCTSEALSSFSEYSAVSDDLAFVPLPTVNGEEGRSLWGGRVFAVNARASEEQAEGVMLFLRYAGYGPETDETSVASLEKRYACLNAGDTLVLPQISVWKEESAERALCGAYEKYGNVYDPYYRAFYSGISQNRRPQEPYCRSELYAVLGDLQRNMLFSPTTTEIVALLEEAERAFNDILQ